MALRKYCSWIDFRVGCIIIACLGILVNCALYGTNIHLKGTSGIEKIELFDENFYLGVTGCTIGLIGNLCLLYGAAKSKKNLVALYLILEPIGMAFCGVFCIFSALSIQDCMTDLDEIKGELERMKHCSLFLVNAVIGANMANPCIMGLIWFFIFCFFRNLKQENGNILDQMQECEKMTQTQGI